MKPSWHSSPDSRISFSSIVRILELLMDSEETLEYQKLAEEYAEMAKLLLFNESRKSGQQSSQDILRSPSSLPPSYSR